MSDHKELSYRRPAGRFAGCENRAGKGDLLQNHVPQANLPGAEILEYSMTRQ